MTGFESDPGDEQPTICPDCRRDESVHEMFQPPRCPVVRMPRIPPDLWAWMDMTPAQRRAVLEDETRA